MDTRDVPDHAAHDEKLDGPHGDRTVADRPVRPPCKKTQRKPAVIQWRCRTGMASVRLKQLRLNPSAWIEIMCNMCGLTSHIRHVLMSRNASASVGAFCFIERMDGNNTIGSSTVGRVVCFRGKTARSARSSLTPANHSRLSVAHVSGTTLIFLSESSGLAAVITGRPNARHPPPPEKRTPA